MTKNFIKNAIRTESANFGLDKYKVERILHSIIGLQTESGEFTEAIYKNRYLEESLDLVNLKEEIGDMLWYIAIIVDELKSHKDLDELIKASKTKRDIFDSIVNIDLIYLQMRLQIVTAEYSDIVKKNIFYKRETPLETYKEKTEELMALISITLEHLNSSFEEECERVINKLKKRYPEKFTEDKAENRDLETERKELEKNLKVKRKQKPQF
jgi:NTP pyrophosphatase (non-canonical NTP hydrolase)